MQLFKKHIPIFVAFLIGMAVIIQYNVPTRASNDFLEEMTQWQRVIAGFAILLGIYSLLNHHYHKIKRQVPGWGFSVVVYVGFFVMFLAGIIPQFGGIENPPPVPHPVTNEPVQDYVPFGWMYKYLFAPMQATMFSVLAFYIASAAFRAFRARTTEATVLLITAIIVMLGRVPLGGMLLPVDFIGGDAKFLAGLTEWILTVPSMAAQRGIMIGIGLGAIATSLRIIFGIERTYMGGGD